MDDVEASELKRSRDVRANADRDRQRVSRGERDGSGNRDHARQRSVLQRSTPCLKIACPRRRCEDDDLVPRARRACATPLTCSLASCACDQEWGVTRQIRRGTPASLTRGIVSPHDRRENRRTGKRAFEDHGPDQRSSTPKGASSSFPRARPSCCAAAVTRRTSRSAMRRIARSGGHPTTRRPAYLARPGLNDCPGRACIAQDSRRRIPACRPAGPSRCRASPIASRLRSVKPAAATRFAFPSRAGSCLSPCSRPHAALCAWTVTVPVSRVPPSTIRPLIVTTPLSLITLARPEKRPSALMGISR